MPYRIPLIGGCRVPTSRYVPWEPLSIPQPKVELDVSMFEGGNSNVSLEDFNDGIWNPILEVWHPKLEVWSSKLEVWNLKLEDWNLKLEDWNPNLEGWNPKLEV